MRRSLLRTVLAVATLLVVWLVVSPASAYVGAPVCDPRGAVGFAPPPQMQDEERSIDIPVVDCMDLSQIETKNVVRGSRIPPQISFAQEPAATAARLHVSPPFVTLRLPVVAARPLRLPPGFAAALERPPQA